MIEVPATIAHAHNSPGQYVAIKHITGTNEGNEEESEPNIRREKEEVSYYAIASPLTYFQDLHEKMERDTQELQREAERRVYVFKFIVKDVPANKFLVSISPPSLPSAGSLPVLSSLQVRTQEYAPQLWMSLPMGKGFRIAEHFFSPALSISDSMSPMPAVQEVVMIATGSGIAPMMSVIESHIASMRCRERLTERQRRKEKQRQIKRYSEKQREQNEMEKRREKHVKEEPLETMETDSTTVTDTNTERTGDQERRESKRIRLYLGVRNELHLPYSYCVSDDGSQSLKSEGARDLFSEWSKFGVEVIPVFSRPMDLIDAAEEVEGSRDVRKDEEITFQVDGEVISYSELMAMMQGVDTMNVDGQIVAEADVGYRIGYVQDVLTEDGIPSPQHTGVLLCGQR